MRRKLKIALLGRNGRLLACPAAGALELLSEKTNAHSHYVILVAFSPDGTKIVSGSFDKTIKVWDSGASRAQNRPSSAKTDACWLALQTNWRC